MVIIVALKALLEKYDLFLYSLLSDVVCLFGVFLFNWSIVSIMLFYWLDVAIMVIFVSLFMPKANNTKFDFTMLMAPFGMLSFFYAIYLAIGKSNFVLLAFGMKR